MSSLSDNNTKKKKKSLKSTNLGKISKKEKNLQKRKKSPKTAKNLQKRKKSPKKKKITLFTILLFTIFSCSSISPSNLNYFSKKTGGNVQNTREQMDGIASWYGPNFHNKKTANGEIYNQNAYTVAHRILPLGSIIKITNLENSKKIYARVNDRGPYKKKRIVDVSKKIATELGFIDKGTARVKLDIISYPKKYDKARGITPYKQKVVQIVAYSQKSYAVRGALKLKQELYPIPVFIDQPKTDVFYVLTGPFNSSDKATQVSQRINKKGYTSFVRSYRK